MTLNVAPGRYAAEALADGRIRELLHRLELTVHRRLDGVLQGEYLGLVPGHGSEPGEAREYQPGDDVRRIDWNVTARLDAPHTRETIADRELQTWALLDLSPSLDFGTAECEKRDLAIVGLGAVGFLSSRTGNRFGVVVADGSTIDSLPAGAGRANLYATLQRVATRPRAGDGVGPTRLAEAIGRLGTMHRRRGLAVVISDFLSQDDWPGALARLGVRHDVLVIEVVDPRELELPDVGLITVVDPETGRRREVQTASASLRARYAQAAEEQRARIAAAIRRAGADHLTLRTDRDWFDDLVRFVTLRRERAAHLPRRGASSSLPPSRPATTPATSTPPAATPAVPTPPAVPADVLDPTRELPVTFLSPNWLWLLAGALALAIAYVVMQRRRRAYAVRFTNLELLDVVAPDKPGWRRHLPAVALLLGMVAFITALARPAHDTQVPKERATIMVAIDTSLSMMADDVSPSRIDAAKAAAESFVDLLPSKLNVGLVAFNGSVQVRVPPTLDHDEIKASIAGLQLGEGTAIGDAMVASVEAAKSAPPAADGEAVPARIVLMSDGKTTVGRPDEEGVQAAKDAQIPISTIAFGTDAGTVQIGNRAPVQVPVDRDALRTIAEDTGGSAFEAASEGELKKVYADIGSSVGYTTEQRELTRWFMGAGLVALLAAAAMSLLWFSRLP